MAEKPFNDFNEMSGLDESSVAHSSRSWPGPRTVVVPKADDAFEFTLRHLVVQPPEKTGSVDTATLEGDDDCIEDQALAGERSGSAGSSLPMETIFVKQVKQDSKAHSAGLRTGDRIISINGVNVAGKTYSQVIRLIHGSDSALTLMVIPKDEDVLQMAYKTCEDGAKETSGRNPSVLSTCRVSLSPATHRRGQELCNRNSATTLSQASGSSEFHSASPSLHIRVRINPAVAQNRHNDSGTSSVSQPVTFNSREPAGDVWISGGSSFYPVTTTARKTKPDDYVPSAQHRLVGRDDQMTAARSRTSPMNALTSEADDSVAFEHQRSSFTYNLTPLQPNDASSLRQSAKLKSYREITLSQSSECGGTSAALRPPSAQQTVSPRASSQESSRLSSHFIHMAPPGGGPPGGSMHLDVGNPVAVNSVQVPRSSASVVGARQQMFVSARPQSYESLFGHGRTEQTPPASCSLGSAASRSSSELLEKSSLSMRQPAAATTASMMPRLSTAVDQPRTSLITERMRRFESGGGTDEGRNSKTSKLQDEELSVLGGCPPFGYDSVAKRAAQFEQVSTEDARQGPADGQGKRNVLGSLKVYKAPTSLDQSKELWLAAPASPSPIGSRQVPSSVTIPLYFRADPSTTVSKSMSPAFNHHGDTAVPSGSSVNGTSSESGSGPLVVSTSSDPGSADRKAGIHSHEMQVTAKGGCRQLVGHQDKTGVEKTADGSCAMTVESISQSTTLAMAATLGIKEQLFAGETFEPPSSPALINTPAKSGNSNIKKFVAFFTDKSPKTVDPAVDKKSAGETTATGGNVTIEGCLNCKAAVAEGKKASDRSWKPFWAVLRGHFLGLYKDRYSLTSGLSEEQSVCVKSSSVEVAVDYVKKRNVFQVTTASGSKFLFQAEDAESMSNWVKAIQTNSESKETEPIASSMSLGLQRAINVEKTSPQVAPKAKKQSSKVIPVSKSPASPLSKTRKAGFSVTDSVESPRVKEHKTWKGKMVKKFGRHRSGSGATVEMCDDQEPTGTFGVPLESCLPSLFNECIPLIVETCTRIVEERGIENQGIYRVPGNSCAVNMLRDELNKFPENIDAESEKWQDVNVVSSLLKLFFRKLPDSLITDELYDPVITAYRLQNPEKKMLKLKKLLHDLPEHNFETFRFLAQHLNRVASREDNNKMDARNLAIVFGPTLVRPQDQSVVLMVKDMSDQCRVVETIIVNVDWFFSSWDEDVNVPLAEENEPISSINSELLAKAENLMNPTEMTRDLSAKDLVSSILHAANKKIRRKDRNKSAESIETEGESDVSYSDRNVDQEMEIQGMRELLESGSHLAFVTSSSSTVITSSPATPAGSGSSVSTQQTVAFKTSMERVIAKPGTAQSRSALDVKRYPAYQFDPVGATPETENSKPKILRRYSEDAFGITAATEHDEVTLRPFMRDGSLVEHAEQQLRRLHLDTRALYHKQELERMERENRAVARERVEREFSKTIQELELEEAESSSPSALSSDAATSGGDGSSVRSAMDQCKLAMYENRLRFFTDFGDRKAFSPVFRQGTVVQSSSSASVSPTPLTRRLSDQPSDSSLRREDDYLLAAAPPTRAHSVSPSIIGRDARYGFDVADRNSESGKFSRGEPSSNVKKFDRSLAVVSENQSSSDSAGSHLLAVGQPLVMPSPTRYSSKGPSTSSISSLAVSFGTDSITRSSTASFSGDGSSDLSAKDSVFSEKTPSESEQTLSDVGDNSHKFRISCNRDEIGECTVKEDGRRDSNVFVSVSQFDEVESLRNDSIAMDATCLENILEQPAQRDELSEKNTKENHDFHIEIDVSSSLQGNESSRKPCDFLSNEKAMSSPPSEIAPHETVDNNETRMSTECRTSDGKVSELKDSHVATACRTSMLRSTSGDKESELNEYQKANCKVHGTTDLVDTENLKDAKQPWTSRDNEVKVQLEHGFLTAESASDGVSLVQSLPSTSENGCLDQAEILNGLVQDIHSNGNMNQTTVLLTAKEVMKEINEVRCEAAVETGSKSVTPSVTFSDSMTQSTSVQKTGTQSSAIADCQGLSLSSSAPSETSMQSTSVTSTTLTQSISVQIETATESNSTEGKAAKVAANSQLAAIKQLSSLETEDIARSRVEHATVVTHSADVQRSALILPRPGSLPSAFSRTFTHLDDGSAGALKQRHSICSSSVRDYLQGSRKTSDSNDGKLRRSESRDLVTLHRTASLPLLPCP